MNGLKGKVIFKQLVSNLSPTEKRAKILNYPKQDQMNLDLCMTERKDDISPIESIFYHRRP